MTTLFIDADACPVTREAIGIARTRRVSVVLVGNETQNLGKHTSREGVEAIQVSAGRDAADFAIVERLGADDVVVTQDLGLAAMVLGRGAHAMSPRGRVYARETIDLELEVRHAEQRHRRAGGRTRGPSAFDEEDRERFVLSLKRLLESARD
jgi:uncharacterized protein YaiI (UPF0178 family)